MTRTVRRTIAVIAATGLVPVAACVLADPPGQLPVPPLTPPSILSALAEPPVTYLLQTWPLEFVIPIQVEDSTSSVEWRAFLDYNPVPGVPGTPGTTFFAQGALDPSTSDDAGVRLLSARLIPPGDDNSCHTIEILVALGFDEDHTPDSVGGASITWFYVPSGNINDCPIYDAGPFDAGPADAAGEASDDAGGSDAPEDDGGSG